MINKIIERLQREKLISFETLANTGDSRFDFAYLKVGNYADKAIDIVNQVAEDFENGNLHREGTCRYRCCRLCDKYKTELEKYRWIKCSERLPEYETEVLLTLSNNNVILAVKSMNHFYDGENRIEWDDVMAWQEKPQPFRGRVMIDRL